MATMKTPPTYTPKQLELLTFVQHFIEKNGYAPTYSEIGEHFGVTSVSAWENVTGLIKKGALDKKPHDTRGLYIRDPNYQPVMTIRNKIKTLVQKGDQKFIDFLLETADEIREGQQATPSHSGSGAGNTDN